MVWVVLVVQVVQMARVHLRVHLRLLLDRGAEIDASNKYRCTALICAVCNNFTQVVRMLLDHGADIGETALNKAAFYGHDECERLLKQRIADI